MSYDQQLQFISVDRIPERPRKPVHQNGPGLQCMPAYQNTLARRKPRKNRHGIAILSGVFIFLAVLGIGVIVPGLLKEYLGSGYRQKEIEEQKELLEAGGEAYPHKLLEMLENNEETLEFVEGYGEREQWLDGEIDLSKEVTAGQVPLLMQWDRRWGYDAYGDGMIGWAGCGPVCMTMAYLYLTDDTSIDPRKMAAFADRNGYNSDQGTSWDFWTSGAAALGLRGEELSLSENVMKEVLDSGGVVVCSMGPGDFTTAGHFILIRGYDENGFFVNDPNRKSNSGKQWSFDQLQGQIKNLWGLY